VTDTTIEVVDSTIRDRLAVLVPSVGRRSELAAGDPRLERSWRTTMYNGWGVDVVAVP
jgi:hypothetical protein